MDNGRRVEDGWHQNVVEMKKLKIIKDPSLSWCIEIYPIAMGSNLH